MHKDRALVVGIAGVFLAVLFAVIGPVFYRYDPLEINPVAILKPPSFQHPFGFDNYGRDVFARAMYGARLSLLIGIAVTGITMCIGLLFGLLAGYFKVLDSFIMRVVDIMMVFPDILLAIMFMAILGPSVLNVVFALSFVYSSRTARIIRAAVLEIKELPYIEAARAIGCSTLRILAVALLPNIVSPLAVQATYVFGYSILAEAALSFVGLGPPPPTPTLGGIISEGRDFLRIAPWLIVGPGLLIALYVLFANLIGDAIRDVSDPLTR